MVGGARFLTEEKIECDIEHRRSVAVLCTLYKIRRNPMHHLYVALHVPYVPVRLKAVLWSHIGILMRLLAAEPRSTAGLLIPSQCLRETILLTLYSTVCDWWGLRAGKMLFYWPKLLAPLFVLCFIFIFIFSIR